MKETEQTEKPKRKYTKHLPEQRVFDSEILDKVLPEFIENVDIIKHVGEQFLETHTMSKEDWTTLYKVVDKMTVATDQETALIAFQRKFLTGKYREKHTPFYFVQANQYIKYMLNHIELSTKYDPEDPKQVNSYVARMYTAAQHLYFFINVKEKLALETNE